MKSDTAPQIGFDRYIQLDWARSALRVRAGLETLEELTALIDASHTGTAAKKKTRTVLNRLWLEPRSDIENMCDRAVAIYKSDPSTSVATLTWGMAIATYPFFGAVAEIVGRLLRLQGECSSAEVHRRMAEVYGEREGTRRMTNMVLQSQADWGAIERINKGKYITARREPMALTPDLELWLVEAALRHAGRGMPISSVSTTPVLFPFSFSDRLAYNLSQDERFAVRVDSASNRIVALV
ncbi:hypothetical protein [Sphingobium sp.]|jgi:hypothetical protein|uniref:hypothetical protein n=1 Tax=Sphingobium sp. TaxID=1912891 RepID=UPI000C5F7ACE|nr:hypothetical protein [Sphingobium sp.]MBS90813.1 hypothetical protein [Sphingobium sp.]